MEMKISGEVQKIAKAENSKALQSPTWEAVRVAIRAYQNGGDKETDLAAERIRKGLLISAKHEPEHTIDDVKKKLEAELKIYRDGDSKYSVEKLIELCKTDKELLNSIMLPHKSYDKAFQYFFEKSRTVGYKMPTGNMVYLDNDTAVKLSVEYFKRDDSAEEKKKAAAKKKAADQKPVKANTVVQKTNAKPADTNKQESSAKTNNEHINKVPEKNMPEKPKQEQSKAKRSDMEGQVSLFDLF